MTVNILSSQEIDLSTRYWLRFFLAVCERLKFRFTGIKPDPIALIMQVLDEEIEFEDLEKHRDDLVERLDAELEESELDSIDLCPLRLAILMMDIRSMHQKSAEETKTAIWYVAEWMDSSFEKLGFDRFMYIDIWKKFYSEWFLIKGQIEK